MNIVLNKYQKIAAIAVVAIVVVGLVAGGIFWFKGNKTLGICSQEAKKCPDGSTLTRKGPDCEMPKCSIQPTNKVTFDTYSIEKVLADSCLKTEDCKLPDEYKPLTNCKFSTMCLESKCNVICPQKLRVTKEKLLEFQKYEQAQEKMATSTK